MKVLILGSGTSTGVPRVGWDWGACDPNEPKNRRTRVSIMVENDAGSRLLVDTSTDLRQQLLDNRIDRIDGVFWTHDHADHCHGIDDLRVLRYGRSAPLPGFASVEAAQRLRKRFDYVFSGQFGYPTIVDLEVLNGKSMHAGFGFGWVQMPHGPSETTGFRFDADGKSIAYATDFSSVTKAMIELFKGVDILVSDCLRREPHPTHANLDLALELGAQCDAVRIILTHLDKSMDYASLQSEVPDNVLVGFDGLEVFA
ncbi:MAG TPA: MBL fold metallo-hydrolase [Sphingomonadaceae bacterium]|nr:MBL fold metallo-hydrolase [Sphingomonadaceae bacterium]